MPDSTPATDRETLLDIANVLVQLCTPTISHPEFLEPLERAVRNLRAIASRLQPVSTHQSIRLHDRDVINDIARILRLQTNKPAYQSAGWYKHAADALETIASRLQPAKDEREKACPYVHLDVPCNKCGWSPNAKAEPDSAEKVAEDSIDNIREWMRVLALTFEPSDPRITQIGNVDRRLRALAAKHPKSSPQAEEVAKALEAWGDEAVGNPMRWTKFQELVDRVRSLQPSPPATEAKGDDVPVVKYTHAVEHPNTPGVAKFIGTHEACKKLIDDAGSLGSSYYIVRLDWSNP